MAEELHSYKTFAEFYPFYLSQHANKTCRVLHFIGSTLVLICFAEVFMTGNAWWLLGMPISGYGFAWIGHFMFEKNRPATFQYPLYSLMGDWVMYWQLWTGKIAF